MSVNEVIDELEYIRKVLNMNTDIDTNAITEAIALLQQENQNEG